MYSLNINLINYERDNVDRLIIDTEKDAVHLIIIMVCYRVVQFYREKSKRKFGKTVENNGRFINYQT